MESNAPSGGGTGGPQPRTGFIPAAIAKHRPPREAGLLAGLAKTVIEAALEAELVEHLGYAKYDPAGRTRGSNSRNGTRPKTVRTVLGPIEIDAPRDRWGTFDPMTVGKWQREVVGVDRLLLPLAAKDAPEQEMVALLSRVYPPGASSHTLTRIAGTTRAHLASWHARSVESHFPVLQVQMSALRTKHGDLAGFPFVSVVGVRAPTPAAGSSRELLSLQATPCNGATEPWYAVLSDLRRRGLTGVRCVVGEGSTLLRDAAVRIWPGATFSSAEETVSALAS
jgi:putative transposase